MVLIFYQTGISMLKTFSVIHLNLQLNPKWQNVPSDVDGYTADRKMSRRWLSSGMSRRLVWYTFTVVSEVSTALMMEAVSTFETLVSLYQTTRRNALEDSRHENLRNNFSFFLILKFINVITRCRHWTLSWCSSVQFSYPQTVYLQLHATHKSLRWVVSPVFQPSVRPALHIFCNLITVTRRRVQSVKPPIVYFFLFTCTHLRGSLQ
jgi:hypothetical protein